MDVSRRGAESHRLRAINNDFLFRISERGKVEEREAGDWNEAWGRGRGGRGRRGREGASRQMLNGACKYRERRDTKGAPKRSGVRVQAGRKGNRTEGGREGCTRSVHRVPGQKDSARGVPSRKRRTGKGSGVATQRVVLTAFCRVWRSRKKKK